MYGKRFLIWSRIGVITATLVLVLVTLFGSIAPASPTLERTKRQIEQEKNKHIFFASCSLTFDSFDEE